MDLLDSNITLRLVERIYEAVIEPDSWDAFIQELSDHLGGPAIQMSLRLPDTMPGPDAFRRVGLDENYQPAFVKHVVEGLPWGSISNAAYKGRFASASEVLTDVSIEETPFYLEFMQPQGLAADWPVIHLIAEHEGMPLSGVMIYRREGGREIGEDDFALLDALVPHLSRAYALYTQLSQTRHEREALAEVTDRLPIGVIILDAEGRVLRQNRSAAQILATRDGLTLERNRPAARDSYENRELQEKISRAVKDPASVDSTGGEVMIISRESGRRAFPVMVGPLLVARPEHVTDEACAVLFIADTEGRQIVTTQNLETLYQLTHAEAELVRLVAEGRSLEQVATERGVTMNTVRSQLKQVFSKTDTSRQGELVHLVLSGVAAIREGEGESH
jgi:DNA-binding CsgD family transcriptional regulator/PAS domain-containing protein